MCMPNSNTRLLAGQGKDFNYGFKIFIAFVLASFDNNTEYIPGGTFEILKVVPSLESVF